MNKFLFFVAVAMAAVWVGCSDSDSKDIAGATTEQNGIALNSSSSGNALNLSNSAELSSSSDLSISSAVLAGDTLKELSSSSSFESVLPEDTTCCKQDDTLSSFDPMHLRDSVLARFETGRGTPGYGQSHDSSVVDPMPTTSSSRTEYRFKTEQEVFYEAADCYVSIFEQESGVRIIYSGKELKGSFARISLYYPEDGVLLRLVNNAYWGGACEEDLAAFKSECENELGVFRDYKNGVGCTQNGKMEAACATLADAGSPRAMLQREANLYKRICDSNPTPAARECSVYCRIENNVSVCDTTCSE